MAFSTLLSLSLYLLRSPVGSHSSLLPHFLYYRLEKELGIGKSNGLTQNSVWHMA